MQGNYKMVSGKGPEMTHTFKIIPTFGGGYVTITKKEKHAGGWKRAVVNERRAAVSFGEGATHLEQLRIERYNEAIETAHRIAAEWDANPQIVKQYANGEKGV